MPFGLKMSQDVFQMWMDQIIDRMSVIIAIYDDICVYGKDTAEDDRNLLQLMQITDQVFHHLKSWICNMFLRTTLAYYDHTQPLVCKPMAVNIVLSLHSSKITNQ